MHVELEPGRQYDFISKEEQERMQEINQMPDLTREQRIFNRYLNGDWKRQFFYRPSKERIAELARYEWVHDRELRNGQKLIIPDTAFANLYKPYVCFDCRAVEAYLTKDNENLYISLRSSSRLALKVMMPLQPGFIFRKALLRA